MLRGLVLALLAAAAVATSVTSYVPENEYLYRYEVITSSALRAANHQTAGLKIRSDVLLQVTAEKVVTVQFREPELCKVHQEVPAAETVETVFEHSCTPVTGEEADVIIEQLAKPFEFKWENGIPKELQVEAEEKYWATNIKKGFVNLLRLNLEEQNTIDPLFHLDEEMKQRLVVAGAQQPEELDALFRNYEEDMVGDCETIYSVHEDVSDIKKFYVNKVRNYDTCKSKPMLRKGLFANMNDVYPELEETTAIKTLSHADYALEGNRAEYIIKSAYLTTHFSMRPTEKVESAYTSTRQRLTLKTVTTKSADIAKNALTVVPISWFYIPVELSTSENHVPEIDFTPEALTYYMEEVKRVLREIVETKWTSENTDVKSGKVLGIAKVLEKLPYEQFVEVVSGYTAPVTDELEQKKREIILDILPTLTRTEIISYITKLYKEDAISTERTVLMINMATLTVTPSPRVFEDLMALVADPVVAEHPMLKKTVLFNAGAIANKIRNFYIELNITGDVRNQEMTKIKESLVTLYQSVQEPREKMDIITLFGNAGLVELFPTIEETICGCDPAIPDYLKSKGIFALRKMTNIIPLEIQRVLLPLYADETLEPHVRVSAFLMIMKTNPSFGVMQTITQELKKESNVEVLSFVCSYLDNIVLSEDPKMHNMTSTIKTALENIHLVHGGLLNSGIYSFERFIKNAGPVGADIRFTLFNNGLTPFPDSAIVHLRTALFGKKFDLGQMGIMTSGLKDLFWNLYGPENRFNDFINKFYNEGAISFEDLPPFEDFLRPLTELVSKLVGSVENINSKFPTEERTFVAEKMVELYSKVFDYELFSVNYNADEIVTLYNTVKGYIPTIVSNLNSAYNFHITRYHASPYTAKMILPTPAGIPVEFNTETFGHMNFQGSVQLEGLSSLSALLQLASGQMPDFTLKADVKSFGVSSVKISMGTWLPYMHAYAAVKIDTVHKCSTKPELTVMQSQKKIKLSIELPQLEDTAEEDNTMFKIKMTPFTMFKHYALRPSTSDETNMSTKYQYHIINVNTVPNVHWNTPILGEGIGLPVQVYTDYPSVLNIFKPHTFFVSPMWAEFKFRPLQSNQAEKFEFEVKYYPQGEEPKVDTSVIGLNFDEVDEPEEGVVPETVRHIVFMARMLKQETVEKEVIMRVHHMYENAQYLKHQFNIQVLSSPLQRDSARPMKFVFNSYVFLPEFLKKFVDAAPVYTEPEQFARTQLKFGFTEKIEEFALVKMFWKRELTSTTSNRLLEATSPFTFTKHIPQMFRNVSALQGIVNSTLLHKMWHETPTNMPVVFTTEVDYTEENMPRLFQYILPTIYEVAVQQGVPSIFSKKATVLTLPAWNEEGKMKFNAILDPLLAQLKLSLELPTQTRTVYGLPLPMPYLFKKMIYTPALPLFPFEVKEGDIPAGWCSVTPNNYIHTFDMMSTKLPNHQCEVVLAKDCSALNIFMVTMKPTETGKRIITVYLPDKKVEIIPEAGNTFTVKINDEVIDLPTDNTYHIIKDSTETEILRFIAKTAKSRQETPRILISSWKYALAVETDGVSAFVKPSDLYRGQICGACSDFQADLRYELRGPNKELFSTPEDFLASYTIQSEGCEVPLVSTTCESVERNVVFERFVNGEQSICVSTKPINQCSGSCTSREPHQISQAFHCMPAHIPSARRLREEAELGPLTLTAEQGDHLEVITEYQTCAPAN